MKKLPLLAISIILLFNSRAICNEFHKTTLFFNQMLINHSKPSQKKIARHYAAFRLLYRFEKEKILKQHPHNLLLLSLFLGSRSNSLTKKALVLIKRLPLKNCHYHAELFANKKNSFAAFLYYAACLLNGNNSNNAKIYKKLLSTHYQLTKEATLKFLYRKILLHLKKNQISLLVP